jgi:hypothetical protein
MCLTFIAPVLLPIAITTNAVLAQYSDARGIELHPAVCEWDRGAQLFAIFHEEAHGVYGHQSRRLSGEGIKPQELEADLHAIRRLKNLGYDACKAVTQILQFRPEASATHPSASELRSAACG